MAVESKNFNSIGFMTLSTSYDARRSSITGTTLIGPNGSAQYTAVSVSTASNFQVAISTAGMTVSSYAFPLGVLQNTPGPGEACDICYGGVSKILLSSASTCGNLIMPSSVALGFVTWTTGANGAAVGTLLESGSSGSVVTAFIYFGHSVASS